MLAISLNVSERCSTAGAVSVRALVDSAQRLLAAIPHAFDESRSDDMVTLSALLIALLSAASLASDPFA